MMKVESAMMLSPCLMDGSCSVLTTVRLSVCVWKSVVSDNVRTARN